ncbi:MAG: hypothetical protein R3E93_05060 [Thiothrix sp.]
MPTGIALSAPVSQLGTLGASSSLLGGSRQTQAREGSSGQPFNSLLGSAILPLIALLLQRMGQQQQQQTDDGGTPAPAEPEPLTLSESEQAILSGIHTSSSDGSAPTGQTASVLDGANADHRLSAGDTLVIRDAAGNETSRETLDSADMYDLRFRENMLKTVSTLGDGWAFSEDLVQITGGELQQPETRNYTSSSGQTTTETVLGRNNYWEVVQRGSNHYLLMRETDNAGNPVQASDAINDVFANRQDYAFDCATPMRLLNLKATLDTIGEDDFNSHAGRLLLSSWYDQHDNSSFDGGFISKVRTAQAGEISVNGVSNLQGETALFNPVKGDALTPGAAYYFDLPGDQESAVQGWNAIYMGRNNDGSHRFWSTNIGAVDINFQGDAWQPQGAFEGYYLGAVNVNPNTSRLQSWDTNRSV